MNNIEQPSATSARRQFFQRDWTWWFTVAILVLVAAVRLRLLNVPLERDEGEYAYAGQLMLQGIPPYDLAYNMKFPGTYAAYAFIMKLFGETPAGIHFGVLCMTTLTALMLFRLGKKILDTTAGMVAATSYAIMSASPSMQGLEGHATHFAAFFATAGLCAMWQARQNPNWLNAGIAGLMFGTAVLMKQHAVFIGLWGFLVFAAQSFRQSQPTFAKRILPATIFCFGMALPFGLCCLILWHAGVFVKFWFWTISYARQYASILPLSYAPTIFWYNFGDILSWDGLLWLLAIFGIGLLWLDERLRGLRLWILGFAFAAALTTVPGFYFRNHYFLTTIPAAALLVACAVSGTCHLWRTKKFNQWPAGIFALVLALMTWHARGPWFEMNPTEEARWVHGPEPFPEAAPVSAFIQKNSAPDARVAVIGSEPEIYFLSHRHSATGYIYTYALMEPQPFALKMQREMIREIETNSPEFIVFVNVPTSWFQMPNSDLTIFRWWGDYRTNYSIVGIADIIGPTNTQYIWGDDILRYGKPQHNGLEVYLRRTSALFANTNQPAKK
jgi:hypothetical protein